MYTAFYGLREKPFALSPDPRFLFLAESHREALAHLLYGIDQGEGFIAVTGEVGTGKTTICRTLLDRLGSETTVAFLFNPSSSATELLRAIASEFGLDSAGSQRGELGDQLNRFLLEEKRQGRRALLIIDEAQNLSADTLEQVRLLSNLETSSAKLIQILLLGQPELDRKLDSPSLRQLRQRVSVRWALMPMSPSETRDYVRHRLRVSAGAPREIFTPRALAEIYRRSRGIPRLVNVLCDRTLLAGYAEQTHQIGPRLVQSCAREIPDVARRRPRPSSDPARRSWWGGAAAALATGLLL
ncbi:MAG: AAA family ATPase, partial [Myxococcota bacterium]